MKLSKVYAMGLMSAAGLLIIGCDDDESTPEVTGTAVAVTQVQYSEAQAAEESITGTSEDVYLTDNGSGKQADTVAKTSNCAVQSSEEVDGNFVITIDYGEGCEFGDGDVVTGKIIITYDLESEGDEVTILTTLEEYTYNDIAVSGSSTMAFGTSEDNENFTFTTETDFDFEWPDGLTATSSSLSTSETIFELSEEAFEFYSLISGNGTTEFSNGDSYTHEITTPLRSEIGCRYVVSGVITTSENGVATSLDYGDGTCDSVAVETDENGNTEEVDLNKPEEVDEIG